MKAGFTGTQNGMTTEQKLSFAWLARLITEFHHGDCVGSDAEAHDIIFRLHRPIIIHPPINASRRAHCQGAIKVCQPRPYIARNHDIVDETERLIATPKLFDEEIRSGTWATVRYARRLGRTVDIIWPDGTIGNMIAPWRQAGQTKLGL